jgi:multiple sugar transport system substrate-binding protein
MGIDDGDGSAVSTRERGTTGAPAAVAAPGYTRRAVAAAAAAVGATGTLGFLGACGTAGTSTTTGPGGAAAPAQIKKGAKIVWAVDDGPTRTPLRQDQVKLFAAQFPDVSIEPVTGATATEKLQALFAAGTPPDMFRQETAGFAFFASKGQLASLDGMMKRDKYDLSDFFPTAWELWKWKGKYYGLPFLGIRIVYYNRALAQQSGARVPPPTWKDAAWTWSAFLEACQKTTQTGQRWGADLGTGRRDWQPWVWNNGAELFNADGTKVQLDEPAALEAVQFLADLIHMYRVAPTPDDLKAAGGRRPVFQGGNLFAYHNPVGDVAANRTGASFDWSLTGVPRGKAKAPASSGGGVGWFLTGTSKVQDETWELMKVLASKESVRLEAVRGEAPPSRKSIANEPEFVAPTQAPGKDMKVVVEALEAMHVETPLIQGVEIDRILDEELAKVWQGTTPAREGVAAAVTRIKPLLNPAG